MLIRYAAIKDLDEIVKIYNSTIPSRIVTADTEPVTIEQKKEWFYEHNEEKRPLWVMEEDEKVVAWLSFQSFYGRPAYDGTVEVSIYVDEGYRGRGIGEHFMEFAIESCSNYGVNVLLAFVFAHNIPSVKMFEKFGFQSWGNLCKVAVLDNIERDLVILGKRI